MVEWWQSLCWADDCMGWREWVISVTGCVLMGIVGGLAGLRR